MNRWMTHYAYPQNDLREAALMKNMTGSNWASRLMYGAGDDEEGYGYIAGGNFPENPMGPHTWDPNAPQPGPSGAIPENKPEPELTPAEQKAKENYEARQNKKKMICGTSMLGNALSCGGMDVCDKKYKDALNKSVNNYQLSAQGRIQQMVDDMHAELNKNVAEHHTNSMVALAAQAATGPGGDAGLSPYS